MRSIAYTLVALAAVASFHAVTARPMPESTESPPVHTETILAPGLFEQDGGPPIAVLPPMQTIIVSDRSAYLRVDGTRGVFDVALDKKPDTQMSSNLFKQLVAGDPDTFQLINGQENLCATRDKQELIFRACDVTDENQHWETIQFSAALDVAADQPKPGNVEEQVDIIDDEPKDDGSGKDKDDKKKDDKDDKKKDDDKDDKDDKEKDDKNDKEKDDDKDNGGASDQPKDDGLDKGKGDNADKGKVTGPTSKANAGFIIRLKGSGKSETDGVCWESSDKKLIVSDCRTDNAKQFFDVTVTN